MATGIHVTTDATQTLTNKTMSGASNTFTNIPSAALPDFILSSTYFSGVGSVGDPLIPIIDTTITDASVVPITSNAVFDALALKANLASPTFTGNLTTPTIKITGGAPGAGKILTSDADGDATWETAGGGSGDMVLASVQTVTGAKTFGTIGGAVGKFILAGSTSGSTIVNAAAAAGSTTITLPATTGTIALTSDLTTYAPLASPTFTGTVVIPTPFTLGATSVTSTGTQLNYLSAATGTTGTATANLVYSAAPTFTGTTIFSTGIQSATIKSAATGSASNLWIPTSDGATINQTTSQLLFGGGSEVSYRFAEAGSFSTVLGVNDVYASHIIGIQPFTEAASGTHAFVSQFVVNPLLGTGGSAATTDAATVFINGAMTGVTPSGRNDALRVDGASYFTGSINNVTITVPTTSATLTLVTGSSLITAGAFATTLTATGTTNVTLPTTGTLATTTEAKAEVISIAMSDLTTAITAGTTKAYFRMPFAGTLTAIRASALTAPTGATVIIDVNETGTTVLSTKLSIDISEKTSTTAAAAAVISDSALADDAEITLDFDQVGSTVAGAGVVVHLYITRA